MLPDSTIAHDEEYEETETIGLYMCLLCAERGGSGACSCDLTEACSLQIGAEADTESLGDDDSYQMGLQQPDEQSGSEDTFVMTGDVKVSLGRSSCVIHCLLPTHCQQLCMAIPPEYMFQSYQWPDSLNN